MATKIEWSVCHRKPERSFFYKGKQFPVCARCTGIHIGYLFYPLLLFKVIWFSFPVTILLILPTAIDGFTQAYWNRESNNWLRFVTGLAAGVGLMTFACYIGIWIWYGIQFIYQYFSSN
jgi:uncharacterized membrane protein